MRHLFSRVAGIRRMGAALALFATALLAVAGSADARGLKTGFMDNPDFVNSSPSQRNTWFDRAKAENAGVIRLAISWRGTVGSKPADPTNPGDPAYHFGGLDDAVKAASAHGLRVFLTINNAPAWAEGKGRPSLVREGSWKPDPHAFGQFAQALGKRYSGSYEGLPRVRYFEVWNEPNITKFLAPQYEGNKVVSPDLYRRLLNSFYDGVKTTQPGAKVIGGALSPFGDSRTHFADPTSPRIRPLVFERKLLCLKRNLKPADCPDKPHFDIFSQHPLNFNQPPSYQPFNRNDVQVATFHKVKKILRAGERAHHVRPSGRHQLWATEFAWYTNPPNPTGVSPMKQAKWIEQGFYLLWKQGARVVVNYPFRDEPRPTQSLSRWGTSGTFYYNGTKKPSYQSFRFPFVTDRRSKHKVLAWGKAPSSGKLKIQQQRHHHWKTRKRLKVHAGHVFKQKLRLRGKAKLRAKVGDDKSLTWHQR